MRVVKYGLCPDGMALIASPRRTGHYAIPWEFKQNVRKYNREPPPSFERRRPLPACLLCPVSLYAVTVPPFFFFFFPCLLRLAALRPPCPCALVRQHPGVATSKV